MENEARLCGMLESRRINDRPFEVVLESVYYDGPVSGILRCRDREEYYRFEMMDWDRKQRIRIFGLATLDADTAAACIQLDTAIPNPKKTLQERPTEDRKLMETLLPFNRMDFLIGWDNPNLKVVAVKYVQPLALRLPDTVFFQRPAEEMDWFGLLDLARD